MLEVSQAQAIVLQRARPLAPETAPLTPAALGCVLAEDALSDSDLPPFDKALMDGYAVRASDVPGAGVVLTVRQEIMAGQIARDAVAPGDAARIMTGAPLPHATDAVVPWERTHALDGDRVRLDEPVRRGQNVLFRGQELRQGQTVLCKGTVLRPQELGLLASVGHTTLRVVPLPTVGVLSTGDEIIEPSETPGPGQIRNSNATTLLALVQHSGARPHYLGIARDRRDSLERLMPEGFKLPLFIVSGGVSAGKRDLVPDVLAELGVEAHFHKVRMKPGKPVFFGTRNGTLVFGLPGNPVSAVVCFELFVRPAIKALGGRRVPGPPVVSAVLEEDFAYRGDRPTYHPAYLTQELERRTVRPVPWIGSADLRALTQANAFIILEPGDGLYRAGSACRVLVPE